jgi:hypothetical protein
MSDIYKKCSEKETGEPKAHAIHLSLKLFRMARDVGGMLKFVWKRATILLLLGEGVDGRILVDVVAEDRKIPEEARLRQTAGR